MNPRDLAGNAEAGKKQTLWKIVLHLGEGGGWGARLTVYQAAVGALNFFVNMSNTWIHELGMEIAQFRKLKLKISGEGG